MTTVEMIIESPRSQCAHEVQEYGTDFRHWRERNYGKDPKLMRCRNKSRYLIDGKPYCGLHAGAVSLEALIDQCKPTTAMAAHARVVIDVIDTVENRCLAVDGPVAPTLSLMREDELANLWKACKAIEREANRAPSSGEPGGIASPMRRQSDQHPEIEI